MSYRGRKVKKNSNLIDFSLDFRSNPDQEKRSPFIPRFSLKDLMKSF